MTEMGRYRHVLSRLRHHSSVRRITNRTTRSGASARHLSFDLPRQVRHVAPNGKVLVLVTNLFDTARFPAAAFEDLYNKRWRIEEAFKQLKGRLNLEHPVSRSRPWPRTSPPKSCATTCRP